MAIKDNGLEKGYIRLFRKIRDWEWYTDVNTKTLYIHCLLMANFSEKKWRGNTIPAGSFITSYEKLATGCGLSVRQVRTALNKLKMTGELTSSTTSSYSMITVNNWTDYQPDDTQSDKQTTSERQTDDKQATTTNNNRIIKNNK